MELLIFWDRLLWHILTFCNLYQGHAQAANHVEELHWCANPVENPFENYCRNPDLDEH